MNKIEYMLSKLEEQLDRMTEECTDGKGNYLNQSYRWVIEPLEKKIAFFKWLLEEADGFYGEFHQEDVRPDVWGPGDVTYKLNLQVRGKPVYSEGDGFQAYDTATILVFKFPQRPGETANV